MTSENECDDQGAVAAEGVSPTPQQGFWIGNWWVDLVFFVATPLLVIPVVLLTLRQFSIAGLYFVVVGFGAVGHHLPSFLRAYGDSALVARYRIRLTFAPVLLLATCLFFAYMGLQSLAIVLLLWGFWHGMMQVFRFARIYDAKLRSNARVTIYLDFLMCFAWFIAGVLFSPGRLEQFLRALYSIGCPLIEPVWILGIQLLWSGLAVTITVAFLVNYIVQRRKGQEASLVKLIAMATSIGFWWFTMAAFQDILIGILLFEIFHDVQYTAIVWVFCRRRVRQGAELASFSRFLFGRGVIYVGLYLTLVLLYGLPAFLARVTPTGLDFETAGDLVHRTAFGLVAASAMVHFYLDSFVWSLADRDVREGLGIDAARNETPAPVLPGARLATWLVPVVLLATLGTTEWYSTGPPQGVHENLVEAVPHSWQAHARYGQWLLDQGRPVEAAKELEVARELHPDQVRTRCDLGRALRQMGTLDEAIKEFNEALKIDPDSAAVHSELGKTLFGVGKREAGLEHLRRTVELSPEDADAYYNLGISLAKLGDFDSSLEAFNKALAMDPARAEAYNARGNVYWNQHDLDAALADFDEAVRINPRLAKTYRNRASVWLLRAEPEKAIADLGQAIQADGSNSRDYVRRGDIYYSLKQYDRARTDYLSAIQHENQYVEPAERMIALLTNCPDKSFRDPAQAVRMARAACQRSGWRQPRAIVLLAMSHAAAGDFKQALQWQQQAIEILPQDAPAELRAKLGAQADDYRQTLRRQEEETKKAARKDPPATKDATDATDTNEPSEVGPRAKTSYRSNPVFPLPLVVLGNRNSLH